MLDSAEVVEGGIVTKNIPQLRRLTKLRKVQYKRLDPRLRGREKQVNLERAQLAQRPR